MTGFLQWLLRLKPEDTANADGWALRFGAELGNWAILGLVALFVALVALTVLSYLREGDLPRRVKLTIAAIRVAALVLAFAILLQPIIDVRHSETHYKAVVVLIDDSLSMQLQDRYTADGATRLALAGKLGVSEEQLGQMPRVEIVRRLLARQDGPLAALAKDHPLILMRFSTPNPGQDAYTQVLDDMGDKPETPAQAGAKINADFAGLSAPGYETNLAGALRDAADKVQGRRVAAMVVITDGQNTGVGSTAEGMSATLSYVRSRIPLYAVGVGDPNPPRNVAMLQLQGPTEVRQGASSLFELTAFLSSRNCNGQKARIHVLRQKVGETNWTDTQITQEVELKEPVEGKGAEAQEVVLTVKADAVGEYTYKAEVEPLEAEFSDKDNAATTKIKISEEKVKVLLVSGDSGWEMQCLRNFLRRSPDRYGLSVWQQNADPTFNQEASSGLRLTELPKTKEDLFKYEVVILYDPAYTQAAAAADQPAGTPSSGFDRNFAEMLEEFVNVHHGGLCYIAGNKYSDENLAVCGLGTREEADKQPFAPLANLLPVWLARRSNDIAAQITRGEARPWALMPTDVGLEHPVLRLDGDFAKSQHNWSILPGVYWSHPIRQLKPLATVLAVTSDPTNRISSEGGQTYSPMLAVQYYGKGRVLYLGTDETWRWKAVDDGKCYQRFWDNVVDFLAAGRLQKKRVVITMGGDRFSVGEEPRIHVEAYDRQFNPLPDEKFDVQVVNTATGEAKTVTLQADPKKKDLKGQYDSRIPLKEIGTFELTAMKDDASYANDVAGKIITVTLPQEEFRRPESDLATLQTIAPDDKYVPIQDADNLVKLVPAGTMQTYHDQPHDIWDVPMILALIVTLLGVEWILRKKYNMA